MKVRLIVERNKRKYRRISTVRKFLLETLSVLLSIMMIFTGCAQHEYVNNDSGDVGPIPIEDYERHTSYTVTHKDWGSEYPYGIPDDCPEFDIETSNGYYFIVDNEDGFYIGVSKINEDGEYADGAYILLGMTEEKQEEEIEKAVRKGNRVERAPDTDGRKDDNVDEDDEKILLGDSGYYLVVYDYDNIVPEYVTITVH